MIETIVDIKQNLTIHKCSGDLTEQEFLDVVQSFYKATPTLNVLWDTSDVSANSFSMEFIKKIFGKVQKLGAHRQGGKSAVVAPADLEYGMARMFQIMTDIKDFPFTIKVFRSLDEANQWLLKD